MENYILNYDGLQVTYSFLFSATRKLFGRDYGQPGDSAPDLALTAADIEACQGFYGPDTPAEFREFQSLMVITGNYLLKHRRALFHGAAFIWKGRAWILTGPSGVGKTTQLKHWLNSLDEKIQVINGDKPVIKVNDGGTVNVSSSPWRGKERAGNAGLYAELGGIIVLEQGKVNRIERLSARASVYDLFMEFVCLPETEEQLRLLGSILDDILTAVPVWKLTNKGDTASADLCRDALLEYLEAAG